MAERAAIEDVVSSAKGALPLPPSVPGSSPRIFCVKCAADLTPLPPAAKFCNRCGSSLPEHFHRYQTAQPAAATHSPAPPPAPFQPPQILLAYARALLNLGWRYESAVGSGRNLEEAARCYWKAARLSAVANPAAVDDPSAPPFASVCPQHLS
jgi:hypothetical protein